MINSNDLTPPPATEPVLVGEAQPAETGFRIPLPEDPAERAQFEAGVARREALGLSPFVGEDVITGALQGNLPDSLVPAVPDASKDDEVGVPVTSSIDTAVGEVIAMHDFVIERGLQVPTVLSAAIEQLRQAARLEAPLPKAVPLMNVRVLDRGGLITSVRMVTIPAVCPRCSGPRSQNLIETRTPVHGLEMVYDRWTNPCGHTDMYEAVLVEARRFNELVRGGA